MARPFDDDSGVLASRGLSPQFPSYDQQQDGSPFWAPTGRSVTAPQQVQPTSWSPYGQWTSNGRPAPPKYPSVGLGIRRRPRWVLRFFFFFVLVGAGTVAMRKHLPPFPRSFAEASRLVDQGKAWVGRTTRMTSATAPVTAPKAPAAPVAKPAAPAPTAAAVVRARGPEIVPMPTLPSQAAAPKAVPARVAARAHRDPLAMVPTRRHRAFGARARAAAARAQLAGGSALAAVPFKKARAAGDPFEDSAAPRPAATPGDDMRAEKPEPVAKPAAAPREALARVPAEPREPLARVPADPPAPKAAPDSLDALMAVAVGHPVRRSKAEPASEAEEPAPRKKAEPPPPAHALSRTEIQTVMRGVQAKVSDCYRKFQVPGSADVKIAVGENGSVTAVSVSGPVAGTPSGACVERAVENAVFPDSSGLRFDYRLQLR